MKGLPKKISIPILVVLSFLLVTISAYVYWKYYKNRNVQETGKTTITFEDKNAEDFDFFPFGTQAYSKIGNEIWTTAIFQGIVSDYKLENGYGFVKINYYTSDAQLAYVWVMIKAPLSEASRWVDLAESFDEKSKIKSFLFDRLSVWSSLDIKKQDRFESYYTFDQFKERFPKDTILSFRIIINSPNKILRTDKFCKESGIYYCISANLTDRFTKSSEQFWSEETPMENEILIPYNISSEMVLNVKK